MKASFYDTRTSSKTEVTLRFDEEQLVIDTPLGEQRYDLETITFSSRLGKTPRFIYLPDKRVCETEDNDGIDAILKRLGRDRHGNLLHFLESKLRYLVAAVAITALFSYLFVMYGLPKIAKETAQKLPASMVYRLDASTLETLDKTLLEPSQLSKQRQKELDHFFSQYINTAQEWPKIRILFRSGESVGANAFALPDGTIVFTDDLVKLAKDDKELLSIFFHELGHVQKRHALQTVLQDTAFYLLLSSITGDVTAAGSAFAVLPTMLVESNYSRDMEVEADDYAYEMMKRHGIGHQYFVSIMSRLMEQIPDSNNSALEYLSDHPLTQSRIERFQKRD